MNYSPRTLMLIVAGVATACLAFADPILGDLYYTAGLLLFAFGIIVAVYSAGHRRAFWTGFVILFGIYCSQTMWSFFQYGGGRNTGIGLITSRLLAFAYEGMHPTGFLTMRGQYSASPAAVPGNLIPGYIAFLTMGHTLIAVGLGVVGGQVAQRLASPAVPVSNRSLEEILDEIDRS